MKFRDLETDKNATGFSLCISSQDGKMSATMKSRLTAADPLEVVSNDDISNGQLYAICDALDKFP